MNNKIPYSEIGILSMAWLAMNPSRQGRRVVLWWGIVDRVRIWFAVEPERSPGRGSFSMVPRYQTQDKPRRSVEMQCCTPVLKTVWSSGPVELLVGIVSPGFCQDELAG